MVNVQNKFTPAPFDALVQRIQNLVSFKIFQIDAAGEPIEWYEVKPAEVVPRLLFSDSEIAVARQTIGAEILEWGRLAAQAYRIFQIQERKFRTWKAKSYLAMIEAAEKAEQKKPSDKVLEATYRAHKDYVVMSQAVERAEEAYLTSDMIVNAFKAKERMLYRPVTHQG